LINVFVALLLTEANDIDRLVVLGKPLNFDLRTHITSTRDPTSAIRAYGVYRDDILLRVAIATWNHWRIYTISDEEAKSGISGVKSVELRKECDGGKSSFPERFSLLTVISGSDNGGRFLFCVL
jgi:hypothetical protein